MKRYMIIAAFTLYNVLWTMENTESMDLVIKTLSNSVYRTQQYKASKETVNEVIAIDENGKKILEVYDKTRSNKKRFTLTNTVEKAKL